MTFSHKNQGNGKKKIILSSFRTLCYSAYMTKAEIRNEIKTRIASLSAEELHSQSDELCSQIISSTEYLNCTILLAYMPLADEVDIISVISDALVHRKTVFLPRITPGTNQMEFYSYEATTPTTTGSFGITEPAPNEQHSLFQFLGNHKTADKILMLVPGRAFTKDGRRLGRGKGFYDIYFARLKAQGFTESIKKSGVCFACQLMTDIPTTPEDILMDKVYF